MKMKRVSNRMTNPHLTFQTRRVNRMLTLKLISPDLPENPLRNQIELRGWILMLAGLRGRRA
jgi:hypothetical protein